MFEFEKICLTTMLVVFVALFYCVKELLFYSCGSVGVVLLSTVFKYISRHFLYFTSNELEVGEAFHLQIHFKEIIRI